MKTNAAELVFILDKSGSMHGLERDTIGGFNSMLEKQKALPGECRVTTVLFNHRYELLHDRVDLRAVSPMTASQYTVGGCTALLDAMGLTIEKLIRVQKSTAEEYRAEKVLFVIITDGMENASRRYSADRVRAMVEKEKERYGWEFLFLGANIDAVETARHIGISADRAAEYVPDEAGTELNFEVMSSVTAAFREGCPLPTECMDAIREDNAKRGSRR